MCCPNAAVWPCKIVSVSMASLSFVSLKSCHICAINRFTIGAKRMYFKTEEDCHHIIIILRRESPHFTLM